jgi:hypothetical protein
MWRRSKSASPTSRTTRSRAPFDTRVAAVVARVLNVLLRAVTVELRVKEQQELEARLEELEAALGHDIRYEA